MKQKLTLMTLLLVSAIFYWGCNQKEISAVDNTARNAKAMEAFNAITQQIADAKAYFVSTVDTNVVQKFKKTALWDRAYISHFTTGDKVTIAFTFDKNYTFKTSTSGSQKLALQQQVHMYIYKDANGKYKYDIVTMMPDETSGTNSGFSGLVKISDWSDKTLSIERFKNGKKVEMKVQTITNNTGNITTLIIGQQCENGWTDYYYCDAGWNTLDDCNFLFRECANTEGGGGSGGGSVVVDSVSVTHPVTWIVATSSNILGYWEVKAYEVLTGIKIQAESGGGHFTGISHTPATLIQYSQNYPSTYTLVGETAWVESASIAKSNVSGTVVNSIGPKSFNPTQPFSFSTLFP